VNYYFIALLVACCLYAFWGGGGPERLGAALYALSVALTIVSASAPPVRWQSVEVGVFIVDVLVLVAFIILALRANRFWPIWVSALLGLGVLGHLARWAGPDVIPWAYAAVLSMWSYPILLLIAAGTLAHRRRLKRNGADPSWTRSSAPPGPPTPAPGPTR
jgi:hypothetical protein